MSQELRGKTQQLRPNSCHGIMSKGLHYLKQIFDPNGPLGYWAFVVVCMVSIDTDSPFLLTPEIDDDKMCIRLNEDTRIEAIFWRSVADFLFIIYRLFPLCTRHESLGWLLFMVDLIAVIPVPQVLVSYHPKDFMFSYHFLLIQHPIRIIRMFPSYRRQKKWSIHEAAIFATVIFIYTFVESGSAFGSLWYFLAIKREITCWMKAFADRKEKWSCTSFYCNDCLGNYNTFLNESCYMNKQNTLYDFGMYGDALQSGIVKVKDSDFLQKAIYCTRWGLQNLSSFGQGLQPTADNVENIFVVSITLGGVWLLVLLIGIFQMILQKYFTRSTENISRMREIVQWKHFRGLSKKLRWQIKKYQPVNMQETTSVDVENLLSYLSEKLGKNTKRELCLPLLKKVNEFGKRSNEWLENLCDRVKPVLYRERSYIVRQGETIDQMIFVLQGKFWSYTSSSRCRSAGSSSTYPSKKIDRPGYLCGEELVDWAKADPDSSNLPISTRTIQALTNVEAFVLIADDLKNCIAVD